MATTEPKRCCGATPQATRDRKAGSSEWHYIVFCANCGRVAEGDTAAGAAKAWNDLPKIPR